MLKTEIRRSRKEAILFLAIGCLFLIFAYLVFPYRDQMFYFFIVSGIIQVSQGIYSFIYPLAAMKSEILRIYCRPFKHVEIDTSKMSSMHTSGPGIYPKNYHFDFLDTRVSFNPNHSWIANDGIALKRFFEGEGIKVKHITESQ